MFWSILIVLIIFIFIFDINCYSESKQLSYFFVLVLFILFSGLRYRVGIDTIRYMDDYDAIPSLLNLKRHHFYLLKYEPLWIVFCSILKLFSSSFVLLQFVHAIILNSIIFYFIKRHTKYIFSCALLYLLMCYFLFNFETIRESLSVAIFLLSVNAYMKKRWIQYYFFISICFFIHFSALPLIFLPIIRNIQINRKSMSLLYFLIVPLFLFFHTSLKYVDFSFFGELFAYKAKVYFNRPYNIGVYPILKNIVMPIVVLLIWMHTKNRRTIFDPFLFSFIFFSFCSLFIAVFIRISNYLIFFYIIVLVDISYYYVQRLYPKKLSLPIVLFILFIFSSSHIAFYFTKIPNTSSKCYHRYFPYGNIITEKKYYNREMIYLYEWDEQD